MSMTLSESDFAEIVGASLEGVLVGKWCIVLNFSKGISITIQSNYKIERSGFCCTVSVEKFNCAQFLFDILDRTVLHARYFDDGCILSLRFDDETLLEIIPEHDGLESYIFSSPKGIIPIALP